MNTKTGTSLSGHKLHANVHGRGRRSHIIFLSLMCVDPKTFTTDDF